MLFAPMILQHKGAAQSKLQATAGRRATELFRHKFQASRAASIHQKLMESGKAAKPAIQNQGLLRKLFLPFLLVLMIQLQTSPSGDATVFKQVTLSSLAKDADSVVVGRVIDVRTAIEKGEPWTFISVSVEKVLKGSATANVVFRIPGGERQVNGRTLVTRVDGVPSLSIFDRGVIFLKGSAPSYPGLLGWEKGFCRIELRNGVELVTSNTSQEMPLSHFLRILRKNIEEK